MRQQAEVARIADKEARDAEKERKRKIEDAKLAKQKAFEEDQRRKLENMFKDMGAVQAKPTVQKEVRRFEDVMAEEEK